MPRPLIPFVLAALTLLGSGNALACPCDGDDDIEARTDFEPPIPSERPDALTISEQDIAQMLAQIRAAEARRTPANAAPR